MNHVSPFEAIRRENEDGSEYWSARDLARLLDYRQYNKFTRAIEKAEEACLNSGQLVSDHFTHVSEMVNIGSGAQRRFDTVFLSRYACYLIIQNADPSKPIVALGQTYFTVQTRRQEIADEVAELPEDQLRIMRRSQLAVNNRQLAETAQGVGVITSRDFAIFQDHGYMGLYNGLKAKDIHARKQLKKKEEILDWMNSDELAANAFRSSLARQKLEREQVQNKENANDTHREVGKIVRKAIEEAGGTMPEDMPTPATSVQQIARDEQLRIERQRQPFLFDGKDKYA